MTDAWLPQDRHHRACYSTERSPQNAAADRLLQMRVCLIYDCLYPNTIGGAELWYRNLGERLVLEDHTVTYLTMRQWEGSESGFPEADVIAVGPQMERYVDGRRRIQPPLRFGFGVLWHLLRYGRRYDVVHTAATPFFGLLAAALLRPVHRYKLVVDWHEVWTLGYWQEYLGHLGGRVGWSIQRICAHTPQRAFCFSRLHAQRLKEEGLNGDVSILEGEYVGAPKAPPLISPRPVVLFVGRHIPEKRVPALVSAFPLVLKTAPELNLLIYGDGVEREAVLNLIHSTGLADTARAPGIVSRAKIDEAMRNAVCLVLPSSREGYGMVVVEAIANGTPAVVVAGEDNAAVELIAEGINGFVAPSASSKDLAKAILEIHHAGTSLRKTTAAWYDDNARRLSLENSLDQVLASYREQCREPRSSVYLL